MQNNITPSKSFQTKTQQPFFILSKNATLCKNKEFFYLIKLLNSSKIKKEKQITEDEYIEATKIITNLDSIYSDMNNYEKKLYKKSIITIKQFLSYTK